MARELSFRIRAGVPVEHIRATLQASPGFYCAPDGRTVAPGVTDASTRGESPIGRAAIEEEFGFEPDVRVVFRLDKFDEWERGVQAVLGACAVMIRALRADAVLLEDGEHPLLTARDGVVELSEAPDFWTAARRSTVAQTG